MTSSEKKLSIALVLMVSQYLGEDGDEVDSRSMSAGEHAIAALADVGLMEVVNTRFGRWTEAGKQFRRDVAGLCAPAPTERLGQIKLVRKQEPEN